ncbi:MAG: hypothetical protein JNK33_05985 [Candidatus Doudnabacteria bacterium]|nr:hypothetical protein [Candidatus Doudnabacteria bacterium]
MTTPVSPINIGGKQFRLMPLDEAVKLGVVDTAGNPTTPATQTAPATQASQPAATSPSPNFALVPIQQANGTTIMTPVPIVNASQGQNVTTPGAPAVTTPPATPNASRHRRLPRQ